MCCQTNVVNIGLLGEYSTQGDVIAADVLHDVDERILFHIYDYRSTVLDYGRRRLSSSMTLSRSINRPSKRPNNIKYGNDVTGGHHDE
nr:hypothetical protein [Mycobacterium lepromatosis]